MNELSSRVVTRLGLNLMIKREWGFNRKANDWEFLTVSGNLKKIEAREKQGKCQKCHATQAGYDYAWRYPVAP